MNEELQQIFGKQLAVLPKEVVDFLSSVDWSTMINDIGSLYNLSEDQLFELKNEVAFVLAGIVHPDEFQTELEREAGIKGSILEAIVKNVEDRIFVSVRAALVNYFEQEAVEEVAEELSSDTENIVIPTIQEESQQTAESPAVTEESQETKEDVLAIENPFKKQQEELSKMSIEIPSPGMIYPNPTAARTWEKAPETIPDNLPTEETTESFMPNLIPKTITPEEKLEPTPVSTPPEEVHPFEEKMKKVFTAGQQSMGELTIEQAVSQVQKAAPARTIDPYREPIE